MKLLFTGAAFLLVLLPLFSGVASVVSSQGGQYMDGFDTLLAVMSKLGEDEARATSVGLDNILQLAGRQGKTSVSRGLQSVFAMIDESKCPIMARGLGRLFVAAAAPAGGTSRRYIAVSKGLEILFWSIGQSRRARSGDVTQGFGSLLITLGGESNSYQVYRGFKKVLSYMGEYRARGIYISRGMGVIFANIGGDTKSGDLLTDRDETEDSGGFGRYRAIIMAAKPRKRNKNRRRPSFTGLGLDSFFGEEENEGDEIDFEPRSFIQSDFENALDNVGSSPGSGNTRRFANLLVSVGRRGGLDLDRLANMLASFGREEKGNAFKRGTASVLESRF